MQKRAPSKEERAVAQCVQDMIKAGEVGLEYRDEDDCEIIWNKEAALKAIAVLFDQDPVYIGKEIIEDMVWKVANPSLMMVFHPDYDKAKEADEFPNWPEDPGEKREEVPAITQPEFPYGSGIDARKRA